MNTYGSGTYGSLGGTYGALALGGLVEAAAGQASTFEATAGQGALVEASHRVTAPEG